MLFIIRQLLLIVVVLAVVLFALTIVVPYFKMEGTATVRFREGVSPQTLTGEVTKKDRYIVVKPAGGEEQIYTWDQVQSITGAETAYAKRFSDISDLLELIAKLGILAAALVFLIGLYQFEVGQTWKREEFLAETVNDFSARSGVQSAKRMLEVLMFFPQGRKINLFPEDEVPGGTPVTVADVETALDPEQTEKLTNEQMKMREAFDGFFSRLERFEHYLEAKLTTERSVEIYMGYWINVLIGKENIQGQDPALGPKHTELIANYIRRYEFPMLERLLDRYRDGDWRFRLRRYVRSRVG